MEIKHSERIEAERYKATEYWWVLPEYNFTKGIPVSDLHTGLRILKEKFAGNGIVIHIDQAWGLR